MISKRVKNTHFISSNDDFILIRFTNLRKEGFVPRKGPSSFDFMIPAKVNSCFVSCLESLKLLRRLQNGLFDKFSP